MSTSITTAFVAQYESEVHHLFQRYGGILRSTVRTKPNVVGSTTTFQKIASGAASTKARHGVITPMNVVHTTAVATLADFYAGDWVDRLDEAKINHDERQALAKAGASALGRKVDDQILTALDGTTQTTVTFTLTSKGTVENALLDWAQTLNENSVPNDGERFALLTPFAWTCAMKLDSFANSQWVGPDGTPYAHGGAPLMKWKDWNGVRWSVHTGIQGVGTATAKMFMWHRNAVGYATGAHPNNMGESGYPAEIRADIQWHNDRAAHFINHWMSGGAVLIDDTGVVECDVDDTGTVPISAS